MPRTFTTALETGSKTKVMERVASKNIQTCNIEFFEILNQISLPVIVQFLSHRYNNRRTFL
jgi:hypothetical protein